MVNMTPLHFVNQSVNGPATQILKTEHQAVCQMLNVLDKAVNRLENREEVSPEIFEQLLEFFTVFVDRCHHSKEEEVLFPAMGQAGVPVENGPIGQMLAEHEQGRALIRQMKLGIEALKAGDVAGQQNLINGARSYNVFLREHIQKENRVMFVIADNMLDPQTQETITERFEDIELNKLGAGTHERLHSVMDNLVELTASWPGGGPGHESEGCSCKCSH